MEKITAWLEHISAGDMDATFTYLYGADRVNEQRARYKAAIEEFKSLYGEGREVALVSTPGRTEVCGNHTDHQNGRVLAAGVNLDVIAVVAPNEERVLHIKSQGFKQDDVELSALAPKEEERNQAAALIRGVAARLGALGYAVGGLDAYTTSDVPPGSGLSSSAAFEGLVGEMLNVLYNGGEISPVTLAQAGQYAENEFFGKPSGLMDQTACAVGGFVSIDFEDPAAPIIEKVDFDFAHSSFALCIVDTKGDHADLTADYAAMPQEMRQVAAQFEKNVLREVNKEEFFERLPKLKGKVSDRALIRAIHFYADNERVPTQVAALRRGDFEAFRELVIESGRSSAMYLQNLYSVKEPQKQGLTLALALSELVLRGKGAWRVHGGGIAGTIQAFVPNALVERYQTTMDDVFGPGSCHTLSIRPIGVCEVTADLQGRQKAKNGGKNNG